MNLKTKYKIKIILGISITCVLGFNSYNLKGQNYFSKNNFHYLDQYSISGGVLINQANQLNFGYKPNKKPLINASISAIRLNNFSINISLGYREKSLVGYGNYPWLRLIRNLEPTEIMSFQNYYQLNFSYLNTDALFKITFLQKYKLQPFIYFGARHNKILSFSDSLDIYNKTLLSNSFKKRDNYINSFFGIGFNYSINSSISIHAFFEQNNDMIPNKQIYFNTNQLAHEKEIRFLSYSFQIGIQYTLTKSYNKVLKQIKEKNQ